MSNSYALVSEHHMRAKVDACKQTIGKLLNAHKASVFHCADAQEVQHHSYSDKYLLAEQLTTTAAACLINCFDALISEFPQDSTDSTMVGRDTNIEASAAITTTATAETTAQQLLQKLREWAKGQEVTLRFELQEQCEFEREQQRDEEDPIRVETEVAGLFKATAKVVRKVTEFFFRYDCCYRLVAYRGIYCNDHQQQQQQQSVHNVAVDVGDDNNSHINSSKFVLLRQKIARQQLLTRSKSPPFPQKRADAFEVNISWLLRLLHADSEAINSATTDAVAAAVEQQSDNNRASIAASVCFRIDRAHVQCFTPYQNCDVLNAEAQLQQLEVWTRRVSNYLQQQLFPVQQQYSQQHQQQQLVNTAGFNAIGVFNPIVPLLENRSSQSTTAVAVAAVATAAVDYCTALTSQTVVLLAAEQKRTLLLRCAEARQILLTTTSAATTAAATTNVTTASTSAATTAAAAIIAPADAHFCVVLAHMQQLIAAYSDAVRFIEDMIRKQLVAAVGRVLQPSDFAQYMIFHNRKLLREKYKLKPFSFAIRRSARHSPEGLLRIELANNNNNSSSSSSGRDGDAGMPEAIYTIASHHSCSSSNNSNRNNNSNNGSGGGNIMEFAINASTKIRFSGDRCVHGWLAHHFFGQQPPQLQLLAQARQFSSYIVLLGRIVSATEFDPQFACIVQNKDEVLIPLQLERIPTPKEFKDAIASLSPEQQRFAKAFRSMQLESTLFAVCTIQIKPQLELVLQLLPDSLTKEIQLTQQLMKLFIEYQIPSDLLSFDPIAAATTAAATAAAVDDFEMITSTAATRSATTTAAAAGDVFSSADRLRVVKAQVAAMQQMIDAAKEEELREKNREREFLYGKPPPPPPQQQQQQHLPLVIREEEPLEELTPKSAMLCSDAIQYKKSASKHRSSGLMSSIARTLVGGVTFGSSSSSSIPTAASAPTVRTVATPAVRTADASVPQRKSVQKKRTRKVDSSAAAPPPPPPGGGSTITSRGAPGGTRTAVKASTLSSTATATVAAKSTVSVTSNDKNQQQQQLKMERESITNDATDDAVAGEANTTAATAMAGTAVDYTQLPSLLDSRFEQFDSDSALRPTIITPGSCWQKKTQATLLIAEPVTTTLLEQQQQQEKQAAFDLLDALTRSGALLLQNVTLHVLLGATHCFDKSLMDAVVQRNVNPIEKVERSTLIMASALHGVSAAELVLPEQLQRVSSCYPALFIDDDGTDDTDAAMDAIVDADAVDDAAVGTATTGANATGTGDLQALLC